MTSLVDLARATAAAHPDRGFGFLAADLSVADSLSYAELDLEARSIATGLHQRGIVAGRRALVLHPPGLDFVRAFWGCVYAGVIPVPGPPPHPARLERTLPRLVAIARDASVDVALVPPELTALPQLAPVPRLATDTLAGDPDRWRDPGRSGGDPAVLQYTSGSTRDPRGVVLTHDNLAHNLAMLREFHLAQEHMVMVHWLPLYHDMGLIRGMLSPLHMAGDCVMIDPMQFVQRPRRWLAAVTAFRGTTIGAPNFGYELCVRRIDDGELAGLDLSSLELAFCSAEPVRKTTVDRFLDRFGGCGLRRAAFRPAYGLAEATVAVAGETGPEYRWRPVSARALRDGRIASPDPAEAGDACDLVSCGQVLGGQEVAIVGDDGQAAPADRVGEIWLRGPSVAGGYWRNPEATDDTFGGRLDAGAPFLRTGDLGWRAPDGGLYVIGRSKDRIIVRGLSHHPQDIEATVEAATPGVRAGCSAAFGVDADADAGEVVVVVCEWTGGDDFAAAIAAVRAEVAREHDLAVGAIVLLARGQLPKTASGKVQRRLARQRYLDGELVGVHQWRK